MKLSTSTKALIIAALAIVLLFVLGDRFGLRTNSVEPLTYVLELDTASVVGIRFEDRHDPANDFSYLRQGAIWIHSAPSPLFTAVTNHANELLERFQRLKVKRDMGMIRLLGERYSLTDSTLCRITFIDVDGRTKDLNLGSNTFAPGKVGVWTYVNLPDAREVYAVEANLLEGLRK